MAITEEKIVKLVDESVHSRGATIEQLSSFGALAIFIVAEDVDDPGTYYKVQGQFNDSGQFELLTAGSGGSGSTTGDGLWNSSDTLWNDSDVVWNES